MKNKNSREIKRYVLTSLIGWADMYVHGIERGILSDNLREDIEQGRLTQADAEAAQKEFEKESDRMFKRKKKLYRLGEFQAELRKFLEEDTQGNYQHYRQYLEENR